MLKPVLILLLVLAGASGATLGYMQSKNQALQPPPGVLVANTRTVENSDTVMNMVGRVKAVAPTAIILSVDSPRSTTDASLNEREVLIDEHTEVSISVPRDPAAIEKEKADNEAAYEELKAEEAKAIAAGAQIQSTDIGPLAPALTERKVVGAAQLEPGQIVSVSASSSVKTQKSFTATSIDIFSLPTAY